MKKFSTLELRNDFIYISKNEASSKLKELYISVFELDIFFNLCNIEFQLN